MKIKRSYSGYLTDEYRPNIKLNDVKLTDYICSILNYLSLIPTVIYNLIWFFYFRDILENLDNLNLQNEGIDLTGCDAIYKMANNIIFWTIVSFLKGVILLLCSKVLCGNENDCNILCLIIKILTSFIPAVIFTYILPGLLSNYSFIETNHSDMFIKGKFLCENLAQTIHKFYTWELRYVIAILFCVCFIFFAAGCMCLKEIWRSRGYNNKVE